MPGKWVSKAKGNGLTELGRTAFLEAQAEDRCRRRLAASPHTKADPAAQRALGGRRNKPYQS